MHLLNLLKGIIMLVVFYSIVIKLWISKRQAYNRVMFRNNIPQR